MVGNNVPALIGVARYIDLDGDVVLWCGFIDDVHRLGAFPSRALQLGREVLLLSTAQQRSSPIRRGPCSARIVKVCTSRREKRRNKVRVDILLPELSNSFLSGVGGEGSFAVLDS